MTDKQTAWQIWGSELSPFALKLALCCRHAGLPYRMLPAEGGWLENWRAAARVEALRRGLARIHWPVMTEEDELPLVPFLLGPGGENFYDSSAIAEWLDRRLPPPRRLIPSDLLAACVVRLIDDYADEFLLYVVHHQRWVVSAADNTAGRRLAREFRLQLGPLQPVAARWFSARQTRRLPYLFSVAPAGLAAPGLSSDRQPPAREGFPPTHGLLDDAHYRLTNLLERLFATRPYLLGDRFTLADAALYGQLGMNLSDPSTDQALRRRCPRLHAWLSALHQGAPMSDEAAPLRVDAALKPLLEEIARIHLPLMQQNNAAFEELKASGQRLFNEKAFDRGEALYNGELDGRPYRCVAKSFQARSWRDCQRRWAALPDAAQQSLQMLMPGTEAFAQTV